MHAWIHTHTSIQYTVYICAFANIIIKKHNTWWLQSIDQVKKRLKREHWWRREEHERCRKIAQTCKSVEMYRGKPKSTTERQRVRAPTRASHSLRFARLKKGPSRPNPKHQLYIPSWWSQVVQVQNQIRNQLTWLSWAIEWRRCNYSSLLFFSILLFHESQDLPIWSRSAGKTIFAGVHHRFESMWPHDPGRTHQDQGRGTTPIQLSQNTGWCSGCSGLAWIGHFKMRHEHHMRENLGTVKLWQATVIGDCEGKSA